MHRGKPDSFVHQTAYVSDSVSATSFVSHTVQHDDLSSFQMETMHLIEILDFCLMRIG